MKRRTFLKQGLIMSAGMALGVIPGHISLGSAYEKPRWRTFEVITKVEIINPAGKSRLWLPIPLRKKTDYFISREDNWTGNCKSVSLIKYDRFGTGLVFAEWATPESTPVFELKSRFMTRDRHIDLNKKPRPTLPEDKAVLKHFLEPSKLIKTDGIVASTSRRIISGMKSDLDKARAIYDWVVENTFREPDIRGCGIGDISAMLTSGKLGGKCADINSLYVGLARAAGLPARDVYGIRCAASAEFKSLGKSGDITKAQHCRAEVYLFGYGWVPVDPADVRKVVLEENKPVKLPLDDPKVKRAMEELFGAWEMNWCPFNYVHDVKLPHSNGREVSFLMYPQAETADGRRDCVDADNFRYTITATEIK